MLRRCFTRVLEPEDAAERVAQDDALAGHRGEQRLQRIEPLVQPWRVRLRQERVPHLLAGRLELGGKPGLPVLRPGRLPTVEDEEGARGYAATSSVCATATTFPSGSANQAARSPHERSTSGLSGRAPAASSRAAASTASSTRT